jgi:putative FmdB family regulatory protein
VLNVPGGRRIATPRAGARVEIGRGGGTVSQEECNMPIYEYQCEACGHAFEQMTTMAKADKMKCAQCASPKTRRRLSVFGVTKARQALPCGAGACGVARPQGCGSGACAQCPI